MAATRTKIWQNSHTLQHDKYLWVIYLLYLTTIILQNQIIALAGPSVFSSATSHDRSPQPNTKVARDAGTRSDAGMQYSAPV